MTREEALYYIQHKLDLAVDDPLIMDDKEYEIFSLCAKALERESCKEQEIYEKAYKEGYDKGWSDGNFIGANKWIPVSERLPKENGWYECTVVLNDLPRTMELFYKNGKWLDNRRIDMFNLYDIYGYGNTKEKHKLSYQEISGFEWTDHVFAWMLLPDPYKESEDKNEYFRN